MSLKRSLDGFRRPAYVGENRCLPCTVINIVLAHLAAGITIAVSAALGFPTPATFLAGGLVLIGSLVLVYLRGYLVPGTPTMTKRYLPLWLLRSLGKAPEPARDGAGTVDVEEFLLETGVLETCTDRDDLCLTPSFGTAWRARIDALSGVDPGVEQLLGRGELRGSAERGDVEFERRGDAYVAHVEGTQIAQWASRAAFIADVAAAQELRNRTAVWRTLDFRDRTEIAGSLRLWLERCPACDGTVEMNRETVSSCCRERQVLASSCDACGSRLFEADVLPDAIAAD